MSHYKMYSNQPDKAMAKKIFLIAKWRIEYNI